jgi:hypothetical protein
MRVALKLIGAFALLTSASAATAGIADPAGDFLASYDPTLPHDPGVDIIGADVVFNGSNFLLSATMNAAVRDDPGTLFVWTVNRGSGTPKPFAPPGTSIPLDALVIMFPDGLLRVVTFAGPPTDMTGATHLDGNTISGTVPLSLLATMGLAPSDYAFGLWSRVRVDATRDGTTAEIADLLTGSGSIRAAVPEPAAWMTMLLGFGFIGGLLRRTRNATAVRA